MSLEPYHSMPQTLGRSARLDVPPSGPHAAAARVIENYCKVMFQLVIERVDAANRALVQKVHDAFLERCIERLNRTIEKQQDPRQLVGQLVAMNPMSLNLAALPGLEPTAEFLWDEAMRRMNAKDTYTRDLAQLRSIFVRRPTIFRSSNTFPDTLPRLVAAIRVLEDAERAAASAKAPVTGTTTSPPTRPAEATGLPTVYSNSDTQEAPTKAKTTVGALPMGVRDFGRVDDIRIITLDIRSIFFDPDLEKANRLLLPRPGERMHLKVVVNMAQVRQISSPFLGTLVALHQAIAKAGGDGLHLCEVDDELMEVMRLSGLIRMFHLHDTLAEAVTAMLPESKPLRDDAPGFAKDADIEDADIEDADIEDADIEDADIEDADIQDADIQEPFEAEAIGESASEAEAGGEETEDSLLDTGPVEEK